MVSYQIRRLLRFSLFLFFLPWYPFFSKQILVWSIQSHRRFILKLEKNLFTVNKLIFCLLFTPELSGAVETGVTRMHQDFFKSQTYNLVDSTRRPFFFVVLYYLIRSSQRHLGITESVTLLKRRLLVSLIASQTNYKIIWLLKTRWKNSVTHISVFEASDGINNDLGHFCSGAARLLKRVLKIKAGIDKSHLLTLLVLLDRRHRSHGGGKCWRVSGVVHFLNNIYLHFYGFSTWMKPPNLERWIDSVDFCGPVS